jgi:hypothetical protein
MIPIRVAQVAWNYKQAFLTIFKKKRASSRQIIRLGHEQFAKARCFVRSQRLLESMHHDITGP